MRAEVGGGRMFRVREWESGGGRCEGDGTGRLLMG